MKELTWNEYYDKFYDLAVSTQKSYSYRLKNFGPADEVFCVIEEFISDDRAFASRFTKKAFRSGVRFTPEQVLEMTGLIDRTLVSRLAENTVPNFSRDQLEEIHGLIEEVSFRIISAKTGINIFEDDCDWETDPEPDITEYGCEEPQPSRPGLWSSLLAVFGGKHDHRKKDTGHCDGNCENCPAHYGYRYGRWYYGHGHQYGCLRGGNGGSTGRTYRD